MKKEKLKHCLEGPIMTILGMLFLILSVRIRRNPVNVKGFLNVLVQAKMLPIVVSILIVLMGIMLTLQLKNGRVTTPAMTKEVWLRVLVLTLMTLAFLIVTYYAGFLIPTFVYCFAMLLYLNWEQKNPILLLVLAGIYTAATVFLVPWMLNLNLTLF